MNAAFDILKCARQCGVEITAEGDRLKLRAPVQPPDELVTRIRSHKAEVAALVRRENEKWTAEDWHAFFDERAGHFEYEGGEPRSDAEARAFECCIVEWMNRYPCRTDPGRCAACGEPDREGHTVVPFGTEINGHTWLHPECWKEWHRERQAHARQALAAMGLPVPQGHPEGFQHVE
jgi:hypothetical protein